LSLGGAQTCADDDDFWQHGLHEISPVVDSSTAIRAILVGQELRLASASLPERISMESALDVIQVPYGVQPCVLRDIIRGGIYDTTTIGAAEGQMLRCYSLSATNEARLAFFELWICVVARMTSPFELSGVVTGYKIVSSLLGELEACHEACDSDRKRDLPSISSELEVVWYGIGMDMVQVRNNLEFTPFIAVLAKSE
jgi:hypothetical protein